MDRQTARQITLEITKDLQVWGHISVNFEALGNVVLYVATDFPLEKPRVAVGGRASS